MAKSHMGAVVKYCGHNGSFIADIWEVGNKVGEWAISE